MHNNKNLYEAEAPSIENNNLLTYLKSVYLSHSGELKHKNIFAKKLQYFSNSKS